MSAPWSTSDLVLVRQDLPTNLRDVASEFNRVRALPSSPQRTAACDQLAIKTMRLLNERFSSPAMLSDLPLWDACLDASVGEKMLGLLFWQRAVAVSPGLPISDDTWNKVLNLVENSPLFIQNIARGVVQEYAKGHGLTSAQCSSARTVAQRSAETKDIDQPMRQTWLNTLLPLLQRQEQEERSSSSRGSSGGRVPGRPPSPRPSMDGTASQRGVFIAGSHRSTSPRPGTAPGPAADPPASPRPSSVPSAAPPTLPSGPRSIGNDGAPPRAMPAPPRQALVDSRDATGSPDLGLPDSGKAAGGDPAPAPVPRPRQGLVDSAKEHGAAAGDQPPPPLPRPTRQALVDSVKDATASEPASRSSIDKPRSQDPQHQQALPPLPPPKITAPQPTPAGPAPARDAAYDTPPKTGSPAQSAILESARLEPVENFYTTVRQIGKGSFGTVFEATSKRTQMPVALKVIPKLKIVSPETMKQLRREVLNLMQLSHPNILKIYDVFEDESKFTIVLELIRGQELFDKIVERGHYSEKDASHIMRQVFEAIAYLHAKGIAHRDLKPENLMSVGSGEDEVIKLADFGFSKNFGQEMMATACGSPLYVAPEVISGTPYTNSVDMWSLGVILYILLVGRPPFNATNAAQLFQQIRNSEWTFGPGWEKISPAARELVKLLMDPNGATRLTALQALRHPWITNNLTLSDEPLSIEQLRTSRATLRNVFNI